MRVVVPTTPESRDRIIRCTNSQTRIPDASLLATDRLQRDIEDYFHTKGYFYDRRKNYHKNIGRPKDRIIRIEYLAQAVMAIVLQEPDNSRARPSSLLKRAGDRNRVFNPDYPIDAFLKCAQLMKAVDHFVRTDRAEFAKDDRNNLKFHVAMFAIAVKCGGQTNTQALVSTVSSAVVDEQILEQCLLDVWEVFLSERFGTGIQWREADQVAKSSTFVTKLKNRITDIRSGRMEFELTIDSIRERIMQRLRPLSDTG